MFIVFILAVFRGYATPVHQDPGSSCSTTPDNPDGVTVCAVYRISTPNTASRCNNAFPEICSPSTPPKYYLSQTITTLTSASHSDGADNTQQASHTVSQTTTCVPDTCSRQTSSSDDYTWKTTWCNSCTGWQVYSDHGTDAGGAMPIINYWAGQCGSGYSDNCKPMSRKQKKSCGSGYGGPAGSPVWSYTDTITTTLATEYTDLMVLNKVSKTYTFPTQWTTNTSSSFTSASFTWDANHVTVTCKKAEYYFHISGGQPGTSYSITYSENGPDGKKTPAPEKIVLTDPVNGNNGTTHPVDVPSKEGVVNVTYSTQASPTSVN